MSQWKSEWDPQFKHRLNKELAERRQTIQQRLHQNEKHTKSLFDLFGQVSFDVYMKKTQQTLKYLFLANRPSLTLNYLHRVTKQRQFGLNKLVDDKIRQLDKLNLVDQEVCSANLQRRTIGNFFKSQPGYLNIENLPQMIPTQQSPRLNFQKFKTNNLKSMIEKQKMIESKRFERQKTIFNMSIQDNSGHIANAKQHKDFRLKTLQS